MFEKFKGHPVGHIIEPSLDEERFATRAMLARITEQEKSEGSTVAAVSSIGSGLSFVGKIVGNGKLAIFGHVEGEVQASTVQIGDGARVEGNIIAEELTVGGRVKGTIRANRVRPPLWLRATSIIGLWQSRRMPNSMECRDDRKMS